MIWAYVITFLRGWLIVSLTALNTGQIARQSYPGAVLVGFGISEVWWYNARGAAFGSLPFLGETYALGAALGTLTGMVIHRWLYRKKVA